MLRIWSACGYRLLRKGADSPLIFFSYSVSRQENIHEFPKELAYSLPYALWSKIEDSENIVEALSGYYSLFALGLGEESNNGFTAWTEPYEFFSGNSIIGITVSAPVYDRTKSPYLHVGTVGVDLALGAFINALGATSSDEAIARLARRTAACPNIRLEPCELDYYQFAPSGEQCKPELCPQDAFVETRSISASSMQNSSIRQI